MIGVYWGTSSFRAFRLRDGRVLDRRETAGGVLRVPDGRFADALRNAVGSWVGDGENRNLLCGMIGSRQGWQEARYVQCPVGAVEIADALSPVAFDGATVLLAPGLSDVDASGVPDVMRFGRIAHDAGADGLTAHPRPDERHIRRADVLGLAELMRPWRPAFEFNIEGYPDPRYLDLVAEVIPEQCTLVPDAPDVLTSEEGWKLSPDDRRLLDPVIPAIKRMGCRAILFVDPDPAVVERARDTGADGIEIYTGSYAAAFRAGDPAPLLRACAATAVRATALGLVVNIGHDLNLDNLPPLTAALPGFAEASIGHELTADALLTGFTEAVRAYKAALSGRAAA
jgi:pyridoxine 5-phosphate synthase